MSQPTTAIVQAECVEEALLVLEAEKAVSQCNWTVGECAWWWTEQYSRGKTDADFGALIGLSGDQVYARRRVFEVFGGSKFRDIPETPDGWRLKWSHFAESIAWKDAEECLQWAIENEATVAEMKAYRRMRHGENLTVPEGHPLATNESLPVPDTDVVSSDTQQAAIAAGDGADGSMAVMPAQDRDPAEDVQRGEKPYTPFGREAKDLDSDRGIREAPEPKGKGEKAKAARQKLTNITTNVRALCDLGLEYAAADHCDELAEQIRQGSKKPSGLDGPSIDACFKDWRGAA